MQPNVSFIGHDQVFGSWRRSAFGQDVTARQYGMPPGYNGQAAWQQPWSTGGAASIDRARGVATTTATGTMGLEGTGSAAGVATTTATASVIYFAEGTAAGVATTTAAAVVGLSASGSAAGVATTTATWGAYQAASGSAAGVATGTATRTYYQAASGSVELTTVDAGALTAEDIKSAVWGAAAASFDTAATMGRALNDSKAAASNRMVLNYSTGVLTIYEADGVTARATFTMRDRNGDASSTEQMEREPD